MIFNMQCSFPIMDSLYVCLWIVSFLLKVNGQISLPPVYVYDDVTTKGCLVFHRKDMDLQEIPPGMIRNGHGGPVAYFSPSTFLPLGNYSDRISDSNVTTIVLNSESKIVVSVAFCLNNVTIRDADLYYVTDVADNQYSIQLYIIGPPTSVYILQNTSATEGSSVTFTCTAASNSTPAAPPTGLPIYYTWTVNNMSVESDDIYIIGGSNGDTLVMNVTQRSDNGKEITCIATENNRTREAFSEPLFLSVKYPPTSQFVPNFKPYIIEKDSTVTLTCNSTDANPAVSSYQWIPVDLGNSPVANIYVGDDMSIKCRGLNDVHGAQWAEVNISVQYGPSIKPFEKQSLLERTAFSLVCDVDAKPKAELRWIVPSTGKRINNKTLHFNNVSRDDIGDYICYANNTLMLSGKNREIRVASEKFSLDVFFGPGSSVAISSNQPHELTEGDTMTLTCSATCNPTCTYSWKSPINDHVGDGRILHITNLTQSDSGSYICTAQNEIGASSNNISLDVQRILPPRPPANLQVLQVKSDSITLEWEPGDSVGYPQTFVLNIIHLKENNSWFINYNEEKNQTFYTKMIVGLFPEQFYKIIIYAISKAGISDILDGNILYVNTYPTEEDCKSLHKLTFFHGLYIGLGTCILIVIMLILKKIIKKFRKRHKLQEQINSSGKSQREAVVNSSNLYSTINIMSDTKELYLEPLKIKNQTENMYNVINDNISSI